MPPSRKEEVMDRYKSQGHPVAPNSGIFGAWSGPVCPDAARLPLYASNSALRSYQLLIRQAVYGLLPQKVTG